MATRLLLNRSQRLVAFWPSFRALRPSLMHTSSAYGNKPSDPLDQLQLPGNIGLSIQLPVISKQMKLQITKDPPDVLTETTRLESQAFNLLQAFDYQDFENTVAFETKCQEDLECVFQECPSLLKNDVQMLFPNKIIGDSCYVMTFCQRTKNDMALWNFEVEEEREELMFEFVDLASAICKKLRADGFFADFIDPCSGTPHYEENCPTTFFETDERYRQLGLTIEDLGCCKVVMHPNWGSHVFVGCIFTNATSENALVGKLIKAFK